MLPIDLDIEPIPDHSPPILGRPRSRQGLNPSYLLAKSFIPEGLEKLGRLPTGRTSFTKRGAIAYFFGERFFCVGEAYRMDQRLDYYLSSDMRGIVPPQICAEEVGFDGLNRQPRDPF